MKTTIKLNIMLFAAALMLFDFVRGVGELGAIASAYMGAGILSAAAWYSFSRREKAAAEDASYLAATFGPGPNDERIAMRAWLTCVALVTVMAAFSWATAISLTLAAALR